MIQLNLLLRGAGLEYRDSAKPAFNLFRLVRDDCGTDGAFLLLRRPEALQELRFVTHH